MSWCHMSRLHSLLYLFGSISSFSSKQPTHIKMVDIQHSGTTLVTALLVPGILTLALFILRTWFRITRWKYDTSDTLLTGAVVCRNHPQNRYIAHTDVSYAVSYKASSGSFSSSPSTMANSKPTYLHPSLHRNGHRNCCT